MSNNVSRRCLQHFENNCQAEPCLADQLDFETNPNRPRPRATAGAPEVSWGQVGRVHRPAPEERTAPRIETRPPSVAQLANAVLNRPDFKQRRP